MNKTPIVVGGAALIAVLGWWFLGDDPKPAAKNTVSQKTETRGQSSGTTPERIDHERRRAAATDQRAEFKRISSERAKARRDAGPVDPETEKRRKTVTRLMNMNRGDYALGRFDQVLTRAEAILAMDPNRGMARAYAAMAACQLGQPERAQEHADQLSKEHFELVSGRCGTPLRDTKGKRPTMRSANPMRPTVPLQGGNQVIPGR